ncbi:sulfotransferase [uncultured Nocardioides sp.]|uniref:sulfotransferase n=1 Tax=uncultured Nocardioides sp. TaxID=198441 RepID=UPI00262F03F7|nr:sulfotransferase [uncultured Nocardioides sp.]HRD62590.1 sulfotransferase [Nocardioides sp.]
MRETPVKVLYIAGVGRSGSTLLERVLGAVPGFVNAGEVNAIFSRVASQDQRCGCGEAFSECPFWTAVGAEAFGEAFGGAFGGWDEVTARMSALQPRLIRQRQVPRLATGALGTAYGLELAEYLDVHHRLYQAIASVSGAEVVVDASKSTAQLFALRRIDGLDLRVVNLVRDSRGVANSWNKSGIVKPQSQEGAHMGTYAPHRLAVLWSALQLECTALRAAAPHSTRVRYEDLVAKPRPTVERALTELGLPPKAGDLAHVGENSVELGASHGVAGSRTRFTHGRIELQLDDAWRSTLPAGARRVVTAVTLPQLVGYGYVGRRADARTGTA